MTVSQPGVEFEARAAGFPTGLTGSIGLRILKTDATVDLARYTTGLVEAPAGSGTYLATPEAPADFGRYVVLFDRGGTITPSTVAADLLEVTNDGQPEQHAPGDHVAILFAGFPTGLVGTLGVRVLADTGELITARSTAGIVEVLAGSGVYSATVACPSQGAYTVFADTGVVGPSTSASEELLVGSAPAPPAWEPTVSEVAARVPMRPKGDFGRLATFTQETQPTAAQVKSIIDTIVARLTGRFGSPPAALLGVAKEVATLEAAMRVELDYFGDQVQAGRSPYKELVALHETALADYLADRANLGDDGLPGTADDQVPAYSFPPLGPVPHAPGSETPIDVFGLDW